jgi:hypothetical protein
MTQDKERLYEDLRWRHDQAFRIWTEESTRAWMRFSILAGGEAAVLGVVLSNLDALRRQHALLWLVFPALTVYAVCVTLVALVGFFSNRAGRLAVQEIEEKSAIFCDSRKRLSLLSRALKGAPSGLAHANHYLVIAISAIFVVLWPSLMALLVQ